MENLGVRFIPTDYHPKRGYAGNKPALCFADGKVAHCVIIDELEVRAVDWPLDIIRKSNMVTHPMGPGLPYPPERFIERVTNCERPITQEARSLLELVTKGTLQASLPRKKSPVTTKTVRNGPIKATAGSDLIRALAVELKIPSPKLRRFLRGHGLRAPYTDEKLLRKTLKLYGKEKTSAKRKEKGQAPKKPQKKG